MDHPRRDRRWGIVDMGADMTPDAFLDDWYAWATNQLSHALIGLALTGVLAVAAVAVAAGILVAGIVRRWR